MHIFHRKYFPYQQLAVRCHPLDCVRTCYNLKQDQNNVIKSTQQYILQMSAAVTQLKVETNVPFKHRKFCAHTDFKKLEGTLVETKHFQSAGLS